MSSDNLYLNTVFKNKTTSDRKYPYTRFDSDWIFLVVITAVNKKKKL